MSELTFAFKFFRDFIRKQGEDDSVVSVLRTGEKAILYSAWRKPEEGEPELVKLFASIPVDGFFFKYHISNDDKVYAIEEDAIEAFLKRMDA